MLLNCHCVANIQKRRGDLILSVIARSQQATWQSHKEKVLLLLDCRVVATPRNDEIVFEIILRGKSRQRGCRGG